MSKLIQHQSSLFKKTSTSNLHTPNKSTNCKMSNPIVSPPPNQYLASQIHLPTNIQISNPKLNKSQLQYKELQSLLSAQKKKKIRNQLQRKKQKEKQRQKDDQFSINLQQFCENQNQINKNQVKVICQYCQQQKAVFSCDNCNKSIYCQSCFMKVHSSQKFKFHKAITINKFTQITSSFQNLTLDNCQQQKNIVKQTKNKEKQKQNKISKQILTNQIINLKIIRQQFASILQQNQVKIQAKWKQLQQKVKEQFMKIKESVEKAQYNVLQQIKILREYQLKAYSIKNLLKIEKIIQNLQKIINQQKNYDYFQKVINKTKQINNQTQQKLNNYRKKNNNSFNFYKNSFDQIKLAVNKVVFSNIFIKDTGKAQNSVLGQSRQTQQNYIQAGNQQNRFFLYKKYSKNKLTNQIFKNQQQQLYSQNTTISTTSNITLVSIPENQPNQKIKKVKSEQSLTFQISYPYALKIQKRNKVGQGQTKKHY